MLSRFSAEQAFSVGVSFGNLSGTDLGFGLHKTDVHDERSVADALADAYGAVNAVSLYVEDGRETFHSVHVESAQRIAMQAQRAGVERLIHVSGIGADPRSRSPYIRKRGEGELAVRAAFAEARLPLFPIFGHGRTRLQPA